MAGTTTTSSPAQIRKYFDGDTKSRPSPPPSNSEGGGTRKPSLKNTPSTLQQHIAFFDPDNDGVIWPRDVYSGFRALGFNVLFSLGSLLIPVFFSYPTRLGRSWLPDPLLRIYVDDIHMARHGSDTGVYDADGHFSPDRFDRVFARFDADGAGGLGVRDLRALLSKDRCAADPAGWSFAFMEFWTTWLLLQKDGRVWKDDLRACYEGTLFWKISEERTKGDGWRKGYGINDFVLSLWRHGTWKYWEAQTK